MEEEKDPMEELEELGEELGKSEEENPEEENPEEENPVEENPVEEKPVEENLVEDKQISPQKQEEQQNPSLQFPQPPSYEMASGKLRDIISKLEQGNIPLQESVTLYQEGKWLIDWCNNQLQEVKGKVLILSPQGDGGPPREDEFVRGGRR